MSVLASRLYAMEVEKRRSEEASTRKSLIGSGDRSERIRTYNYPQGRVTDHRINLTLYKLGAIMDGDLDEILTALQNEHRAELLEDGRYTDANVYLLNLADRNTSVRP